MSQPYFSFKTIILFILLLTVLQLDAQVNEIKKDTLFNQLKEVEVTGIIKNKKINTVTENIQLLSQKDIVSNDGLQFAAILNKVPGVFMQSGSLNTNRITIRGIGARSPFGTTSIRAYFGEIPLTDGNGISTIEDIELATISNIEIHKGPSASSFGVGLGGTIILKPKQIDTKVLEASIESTYGSFRLLKNTLKIRGGNKKTGVNVIYSNIHSDGYRENNEYDRETLTTTIIIKPSSKDELQFLGNYTDLKAFIPSAINLEDYTTNPKSAAFTWKAAQGFEDYQAYITGLSWQHDFSSSLELNSSVFYTDKKNYEPRPFNILNENITGLGARSRIAKNYAKMKWGIGAELFSDTNKYSTFENLYEDFPIGTGSVLGKQNSNYKESRNYVNFFGEFAYNFHENWKVNAGFNINKTQYKIKDLFNLDDFNQSGDYDFETILSPKLGVLYTPNKFINIRASIAHGFAPPTTEETLLPDGLINTDLKPEKGWNYEVGASFSFFNNQLYGDMSMYTLRVADLLVDRRAANDALFALNAGKTNHFGIEGNINYTVLKSENLHIDAFTNFSIYDYKFDEFLNLDEIFSGNTLTGIPSEVFNTGVNANTTLGFYGNINFQHVGSMFADDANTVVSEAYTLVNTKIGYKKKLKNKFTLNLFLGINNILNTKYVSQLQVNAGSFGGNAPRYYYAGNPINYYGGVKIGYLFF